MFWNKHKNTDKRKKGQSLVAKSVEGKNSKSQGLAGDALRAQALANARQARENLGEDTIQKIAEIMARKDNNPLEQAKRRIQASDTDKVADSILDMWNERE